MKCIYHNIRYCVKAEAVGRCEEGERWRGGEADVVGSKFGLGQIPPAAHLTKLFLLG
jgi:hypothetical protein